MWDGGNDFVLHQPVEAHERQLMIENEALKEEKKHMSEENQYLKILLEKHGITWMSRHGYDSELLAEAAAGVSALLCLSPTPAP